MVTPILAIFSTSARVGVLFAAGDADIGLEQAASERLFIDVFDPFRRGGDIEGREIRAAEGAGSDIRAWHFDAADALAGLRIVATAVPTAPVPDPEFALDVNGHAVGPLIFFGDLDDGAAIAEAAGAGVEVEGVDFEGVYDEPVRCIFLLLTPQQNYLSYIPVLAQIATFMNVDAARADVLRCQTPSEVTALIKQQEKV